MKVVLYADNTLPIHMKGVLTFLNSVCRTVVFSGGDVPFRIRSAAIRAPDTYKKFDKQLLAEIATYDLAVLATNVPYENNFFWEGHSNAVIVSFNGWNELTDLPITNGLAYFSASLVNDQIGVGTTHEVNVGCINDFWWDKTGIDVGMRAAYFCGECAQSAKDVPPEAQAIWNDVTSLLTEISSASRAHKDVLDVTRRTDQESSAFDVFMCHNSADKPSVRKLLRELKAKGVKTWIDEEQLPPGVPWQPLLEKHIRQVKSAAVFVGANGIGPWHEAEIRAFLSEFVNRGCPVIPVILPDAKQVPELPLFLKQMTWVDLRSNRDQGIKRLLWAITGRRP